ncbi:MAG TPA: GNAT family N-acetyltransferase [Bryobacteraceae bacterium]
MTDAGVVKREELSDAIGLLRTLNVSYGGITTTGLYRLFCTSPSMLTVVCREQGRCVGIVVVELDRRWLRTHPFLAFQMLSRRLIRPGQSATAPSAPPDLPAGTIYSPCPREWRGPTARVLFVGVDEQYRGRRLAAAMYREVFPQLAQRGRTELLIRIGANNAPSLAHHLHAGWKLYFDGHVVTALTPVPQAKMSAKS